MTLSEFAEITKGKPAFIDPRAKFAGFALDSREVRLDDLFIAIKGERADGHDFVEQAMRAGASAALVERPVSGPHILVGNIVEALAEFASFHRREFSGPVVAITGSAGKTSTKEFVAAALSSLGPCLKTEGNRNTELTAPLLWAELDEAVRYVVVEMGMRGFGQIAHLASFTKPTIGIVTNIGYSHAELVGSREGVAKAKGELVAALPADGAAVLWAEDPFFDKLSKVSTAPVHSFGFSDRADCRISRYESVDWDSCSIELVLAGCCVSAVLPSVGRHMALNAAAAVLAASLGGVDPIVAAADIGLANLPPMRMEVIRRGGCTIVLDTYNASPSSVVAALETLAYMPCRGSRVAVLGEMRELGTFAEQGHRDVGAALADFGIDKAILYGEPARWIGSSAQSNGMAAGAIRYGDSLAEVAEHLKALKPGDTVLIKGSRALEMERVLDFLKEPVS